MRPMIYVSGPLTKFPEGANEEWNVYRALHVGELVWELGMLPYVPHLTLYWYRAQQTFQKFGFRPWNPGQWLMLDLEVLQRCDGLVRILGQSAGADIETRMARLFGIPQTVIDLEWSHSRIRQQLSKLKDAIDLAPLEPAAPESEAGEGGSVASARTGPTLKLHSSRCPCDRCSDTGPCESE